MRETSRRPQGEEEEEEDGPSKAPFPHEAHCMSSTLTAGCVSRCLACALISLWALLSTSSSLLLTGLALLLLGPPDNGVPNRFAISAIVGSIFSCAAFCFSLTDDALLPGAPGVSSLLLFGLAPFGTLPKQSSQLGLPFRSSMTSLPPCLAPAPASQPKHLKQVPWKIDPPTPFT